MLVNTGLFLSENLTMSNCTIEKYPGKLKITTSRFGVVILTIPKMITLKTGKDQDRGISKMTIPRIRENPR